ncbi:MAG: hypothetical protein U0271_32095 [Polyangiaceae bacterium]
MARFTRTALVFLLVSLSLGCGDDSTGGTGGTGATGAGPIGGEGGAGASENPGGAGGTASSTGGAGGSMGGAGGAVVTGGGGAGGGPLDCGTPSECTAIWEQNAADELDTLASGPEADLKAFLYGMPKGGDLHNHLTGAVYAETYLDWAHTDGDCINSSTYAVVYSNQCSAATQPTPTMGAFYDSIVRAWSMEGFVAGAETGHDHFFATFGKFGAVAGAHRWDSVADIAKRAALENQLYVETMFNLGKNVGALAASIWSGTLTAQDLPAFYNQIVTAPTFQTELAKDVQVVEDTYASYRNLLGCSSASPPPACDVGVRFVAQVSRTGAKDTVFGQLVAAYEMAKQSDKIVAANLSSPEDDTTSLTNYDLHMSMLDFLYNTYTDSGSSPLHITLHAGELTSAYVPPGYPNATTYHIRAAVELGHAERIGHGLDVLSETNSAGLLAELATQNVLVEVCLSSNAQILEVSGPQHPLATYLSNQVPVALATDDQGVSRSSMAGEYLRAVRDQGLDYRQLKMMARQSLEHAFVPGASLWLTLASGQPVTACAPTDTMGLGDTPNAACQAFLDGSEKARFQWALEARFRAFESAVVP